MINNKNDVKLTFKNKTKISKHDQTYINKLFDELKLKEPDMVFGLKCALETYLHK